MEEIYALGHGSNKLNIAKLIQNTAASCLLLLSQNALTCTEQNKTALEEIYCTLKSKGKTSSLPDFYQFKNNPEEVQWLLLKGPARKAGITLPSKKTLKTSSTQTTESQTQTPYSASHSVAQTTKPKPSTQNNGNTTLHHCQLKAHSIECNHQKYVLLRNLPNTRLAPSALAASNQLTLPAYSASSYTSEREYLARSYPLYVEKILTLGLAEAVMSYTKFVSQYEEVTKHGGDFAKRMQQMYGILKLEKKSRPVKASYQHTLPKSIEQCMLVTSNTIVCDNITHTWVFSLLQPNLNAG